MRAHEILLQSAEIVKGDRERQHGDKYENHENIAALWEGFIRRLINARMKVWIPRGFLYGEDVASLMELLKVARRLSGEFNPDDALDGA